MSEVPLKGDLGREAQEGVPDGHEKLDNLFRRQLSNHLRRI